MTSIRHQFEIFVAMVKHCMQCSIKFSVTLHIKILSTQTPDVLKYMIILKAYNSVLYTFPENFSFHLKHTLIYVSVYTTKI